MKQRISIGLIVLLLMGVLLAGCQQGPDLTQMKTDLETLTQKPRPAGSEGEAAAVAYLTQRFEDMGYEVALQEYALWDGSAGNNVIAVRGGSEGGDILVISAHHDSVSTSFGAGDNGSGVAALLAVAAELKDLETDTELRLISFTDEENGKNGSRQYVESLEEGERRRIVGCIQLDMLGGLGTTGMKLCTTDGTSNWLTDLLQGCGAPEGLSAETGSDHAVFQLAGIPSALVTQDGQGYLYHSMGDTADVLDLNVIHSAAAVVTDAVKKIASADTGSYLELAQKQAANYIYHQTRQSRILYSMPRQDNEAYLGFSGELVDQWEEVGDFWRDLYEVYQYDMGWFGGGNLMKTHYTYRNGYLEDVKVYPAETGYTTEELVTMITATHGEPIKADEVGREWDWQDELYSKYLSLNEEEGKPVVKVYPYSVGLGNTLAAYDVVDGDAAIDDPQHARVWELFCKALPKEYRQKIGELRLFTDGFSNILAYTASIGGPEGTDNTRFSIAIDYYDVYDENGDPRDWSKLMDTLVHEYAHVLLEDETQIDLSKGVDLHDPAAFIEGTFRQRYYEAFWQDPYSSYLGTYWDKPENYVSEYAGNVFHEDVAETFTTFVFGSKPTGDTVAEQKILFFWEDSELVELRSHIRKGLGLK